MKKEEEILEKIKKIVKEVSDNNHEQFNLSSEVAREILAKKILDFCKKDLEI